MNNNDLWNNDNVIKWYNSKNHIQKPESTIIKMVNNVNSLLDIGVGGGRTTYYFSKISKNYVGIDYILKFVQNCQKNYPLLTFHHMNALNILNLNTKFELVLFSHNGIDNILNKNDWLKMIDLMYETSDKYVCFSSHNSLFYNKTDDYVLIKNNVVTTNMNQVYTNPQFVLNYLNKFKFKNIYLIDTQGDITDTKNNKSCWIYYLCEK